MGGGDGKKSRACDQQATHRQEEGEKLEGETTQELMNNDKPINKSKALLVLTLICLVPTVVLYFNSGIQIAISWFAVSALGLEIKMASKNSPLIELYLDNACDAFENDKSAVC